MMGEAVTSVLQDTILVINSLSFPAELVEHVHLFIVLFEYLEGQVK